MKPFQRQPFGSIPELPRKPHAYARTIGHDLELDSTVFGKTIVHYRTIGEGPPLLLIHGLMTSSYSWRYVLEPLSRHFRVIAPDLPGSGRSSKPVDRPYTGPAYATFIGELCAALGLRGTRCVGNSLGGYLCMRAALEDPGLFSRLVNLHSPGLPEPRLSALSVAMKVPGLQRGLAWWIRRDPLRWAHANVHYFDESLKSLEEASAYGEPLSTEEGSRAFVRILAEVLKPSDLQAFARTLQERGFPIPLLLIYARTDPMVPPKIGERLSRLLPGVRLEWLEDSSHFAHVDSPDRVLPLILEHLLPTPLSEAAPSVPG